MNLVIGFYRTSPLYGFWQVVIAAQQMVYVARYSFNLCCLQVLTFICRTSHLCDLQVITFFVSYNIHTIMSLVNSCSFQVCDEIFLKHHHLKIVVIFGFFTICIMHQEISEYSNTYFLGGHFWYGWVCDVGTSLFTNQSLQLR